MEGIKILNLSSDRLHVLYLLSKIIQSRSYSFNIQLFTQLRLGSFLAIARCYYLIKMICSPFVLVNRFRYSFWIRISNSFRYLESRLKYNLEDRHSIICNTCLIGDLLEVLSQVKWMMTNSTKYWKLEWVPLLLVVNILFIS